jgi:CubicO group peptidase (beta-lactamase class C family)
MKIVIIIILILLLIIVAIISFSIYKISNIKDHKDLEGSIDKYATKYILDGNSIGLVIGILKNEKIVITGYGTTKKGEQILPNAFSLFELASVSKVFTTSTLQLLVDEGILKLDDTIQPLLANKVNLPESAQNTTLQDLATHHSGFPKVPETLFSKEIDFTNPYKDLVRQDMYDYLETCEGKKKEGKFDYSNFGMGLVGHLLELKTKIGFEELVKQKLLQPLEMNHTTITIDSLNKNQVVQGYDENEEPTPIWIDDVLTGAGSFLSNGLDMVKFIQANLDEKETKISKSLIQTHQPITKQTGLGWMLPQIMDKLIGNKDIIWHNGMTGGSASFITINKKEDYGIIILSNKAVDITSFGMKLSVMVKTQSWKE